MEANNWRFPDLGRELAILGLSLLGTAALVGAAVGVVVEICIDRHRNR